MRFSRYYDYLNTLDSTPWSPPREKLKVNTHDMEAEYASGSAIHQRKINGHIIWFPAGAGPCVRLRCRVWLPTHTPQTRLLGFVSGQSCAGRRQANNRGEKYKWKIVFSSRDSGDFKLERLTKRKRTNHPPYWDHRRAVHWKPGTLLGKKPHGDFKVVQIMPCSSEARIREAKAEVPIESYLLGLITSHCSWHAGGCLIKGCWS